MTLFSYILQAQVSCSCEWQKLGVLICNTLRDLLKIFSEDYDGVRVYFLEALSVMMSCVTLSAILVFKCFIIFSPIFHCIMHKKLKIN